jgi:hypothetical protein
MPEPTPLPPIADQPLSVVLLARRGADLESVVAGWVTFLNGLNRSYEILLVADSAEAAAAAAALPNKHPHLRLVSRQPERTGDGACLRAAMAEAKYPLLFYTPCDPQYRPADLRKLLQEIDKVHLASGCRGAGVAAPRWFRVLRGLWRGLSRLVFSYAAPPAPGWLGWRLSLGRVLAWLAFGVRNHDVACPFRLLRREILARIPIQSDGSFAHVEILAKANFLGCLLAEDVALGDRLRPVLPETEGERFGRVFADARRVFNRPDFGPARLPDSPPGPVRLHICQPESVAAESTSAPLDGPSAPR